MKSALNSENRRLAWRKPNLTALFQQPVKKLINLLGGGGCGKLMTFINDAHHKFDGTLGVAQATEVKDLWEKHVQSPLHTCFKIFAEFEAHVGEPRLFAWMDDVVVDLPTSNKVAVKTIHCTYTGIAAAAMTDGRAGDGLIMIEDLPEAKAIKFHNHDVYQLTAGTLDPVADIGDLIFVRNYGPVHARDLVAVAFGQQLLARRYNETEIHPHIAVLTGQATDPLAVAQPVIVPKERIPMRKIVGTLFAKHKLPIPARDSNIEFSAVSDLSVINALVQDAKVFQVEGRSAEPVALNGQYILTQPTGLTILSLRKLDGRLVIAVDENGARYFKRLRTHNAIVILESLNPDGSTPAEILSLQGELGYPRIVDLLEVVGVLFELP